MANLKWLINTQMLQGAFAGVLMLMGIGQIQKAWHHSGQGYVSYEQPEREVRVNEHEYKRNKYVGGAFLFCMGAFFWAFYANKVKVGGE